MIEWGTLVVAILALVQPWVLALWRRVVRTPAVVAHETAAIEVGFSTLGPTLGLLGTLEVRHRGTFVRGIDVQLTRRKDRAQHHFSWGIFRPFAFGGSAEASYELCTGFLLRIEEPFRYNIQFWERPFQEDGRQHLQRLREHWQKFFLESGGKELLEAGLPDQPQGELLQRKVAALYSEFLKKPVSVEIYTAMQRMFYWEPGFYTLEMQVQTLRPERMHSKKWTFELSEQHAEQLRLNILRVLQETCGQFYGQYNFIYAGYAEEVSRQVA